MCTSISDGGQRCAAHTRPAYEAATIGTPAWDQAAADYAATPSGRDVLTERRDQAVADGNIEDEIACQTALDRGAVLREAAQTARSVTRAAAHSRPTVADPAAALDLATAAHGDQTYANRPYVEAHVEPVGRLLAPYGPDAQSVGYLHDTVEDTDLTLEDLRSHGFPEPVVEGVDGMTKRKGETKEEAALRARDTSRLSRLGKLADNTANRLGLDDLEAIDPQKAQRLRPKYTAIRDLLITDPDGTPNPEFATIAEDMEQAWRTRT